jgi:opacity protein-like surface antigen
VFGTAGGGKVILRDQTFGDAGGGVMVHFASGLSLEGQVTRLKMSALNKLACPPFTNAPSGTCGEPLHSGYGPVTQLAFSVNYFLFPQSRVQPYASGGIFRASIDTHYASGNPGSGFVERINRENYVGVIFGGGVRLSLTRAISLRPEFRYSYTEGFRTARVAAAVGYRW